MKFLKIGEFFLFLLGVCVCWFIVGCILFLMIIIIFRIRIWSIILRYVIIGRGNFIFSNRILYMYNLYGLSMMVDMGCLFSLMVFYFGCVSFFVVGRWIWLLLLGWYCILG